MNMIQRWGWCPRACLYGLFGLWVSLSTRQLIAQDEENHLPVGQFVTISGAIDPATAGNIQNVALKLNKIAESAENGRKVYLILELHDGSSPFGQVRDLAKFLREPRVSNVTTVAWIPERVTGNNAILALACNEIVMDPEAEIGDIGRGQAVDQIDQQFVLDLVSKKHNRKLSPALALGMMDPQATILKAAITREGNEGKMTETSVYTPEELEKLRNDPQVLEVADVVPIKEKGELGLFTGNKARANGVLIVQTAENRGDVAELYNVPREALHEDKVTGDPTRAQLIQIKEPITPVLEAFLERQIDRALAHESSVLIFEIESTRGQLLTSSSLSDRIAQLDPKQVRTVAYIPREAEGGAALVALACDEIYLEPEATLGNIGPGTLDGVENQPLKDEDLQALKDHLRNLAQKKNRPEAVLLSMVDNSTPVFQSNNVKTGHVSYMTRDEIQANGEWTEQAQVPETGKEGRLTLKGSRAHELMVSEPVVQDRDELKQRVGIPTDQALNPIGRNWVDSLIFWLNTSFATFLLLVVGIACIYLELHMMTGLLGILSALCFSLFFWSRFLGGTAGWLEIVLFLLGLICIALEIFVIPGFGVFGVSGGLLLFASLILASHTFGQFEPDADMQQLTRTVGTLSASIVSVLVIGMLLSKYLPHIPFLSNMILTPPSMGHSDNPYEPRLRQEFGTSSANAHLIHKRGVAVSILRPAGKAEIEGEYMDVVSDGPYIEQGAHIEVVAVKGNIIVVREA